MCGNIQTLLQKCTVLPHLKQLHALALKTSLQTDPLIAGKLLLIAQPLSLDYSLNLFAEIPFPDSFMYNTIIRSLSENDPCPQRCLTTFSQMARNSLPVDSFTLAFLLKAAANFKSIFLGLQLHAQAILRGLEKHLFVGTTLVSMYGECASLENARKAFGDIPEPNVVAWNAVLTACFRSGDCTAAEKVFDCMLWKNLTSWNVMLAGFTGGGELYSARTLFQSMIQKDSVSWSTMIVGFASHGEFNEAVQFFIELMREGLRPNEVSLTGILSACSQAGALATGRVLHGIIEKAGFSSIVVVPNALLDMYARCGNIDMAQRVFDWGMGRKSIVSWTSMIATLAMYGYGDKAIDLFKQMEKNGLRPDGVTFVSLLYACSHSGLVEEGYFYFCRMKDVYGIQHSIEHYGCMVDIYGRAGLLVKAYDFVMQMPIRPNAIIWRTLLGACSIHGNVKLAEHVKKKISEFEPGDSGDYVLLSNIYAGLGNWKDAANVRRSMSDQGMKKDPGWSSIEVDKVVYTFTASDEKSPITQEAYSKLSEIMMKLSIEGYVPDTGSALHDIEEEEKQDSIAKHSEKLAVAYGIARLHRNDVIRIVKNLRVCQDCHSVMKIISKVLEREIVLRDRSRFHYFRLGLCSCRDYW